MKFKEATSANRDYVIITNENSGCWSYVGCITGRQTLNLQPNGCMSCGTIIHEFLHVLGFFHQQSSADRDEFVEIHYENVSPGAENNFIKYSSTVVTNLGYRYDYDSIMHYGPFDFSKNGYHTISSKTSEGQGMGQRVGLSPTDIGKINKMYNC